MFFCRIWANLSGRKSLNNDVPWVAGHKLYHTMLHIQKLLSKEKGSYKSKAQPMT